MSEVEVDGFKEFVNADLIPYLKELIKNRSLLEKSSFCKVLNINNVKFKIQFGLCYNIQTLTDTNTFYYAPTLGKLTDIWQRWELYSGQIAYPVNGLPKSNAEYTYEEYLFDNLNMWGTCIYGKNRWLLVEFILSELIKQYSHSEPEIKK